METLQAVVNRLKVDFSKKIEADIIFDNYGIKSCVQDGFKGFNFKKLEIIFLSNLCYLNLKENQIKKILVGNYKDLLKKKVCPLDADDIELEQPVIVNNYFEGNNWDKTDW